MIHENDGAALRRDVLGQLMLLTKLINGDMERGLEPAGLTMARAQVIWELGAEPGMTQRVLAQKLDVTPRNVTALVDALEGLGLVTRKPHPGDRRAIQLVLSEQGEALFEQFRAGRDSFSAQLLADVSAERLTRLQAELSAIVAKLEALGREQEP